MLRRYHRTFGDLLRALDACAVVTAWLSAYWLRFHVVARLAPPPETPSFTTYAALTPLVALLWATIFASRGFYNPRHLAGPLDELAQLLKGHAFALLVFVSVTYLIEHYRYSRLVMVYFAATSALLLCVLRLGARFGLRRLRSDTQTLRRVLAVGDGPTMEAFIHRLDGFPELGLSVIGLVSAEDCAATRIQGKPVLGNFAQLPAILVENQVDEVLISLHGEQQDRLEWLLDQIQDETVDIRLVPEVHRYVTLGCEIENFDGVPVVRLNDSPLIGWSAYVKRAIDVVLSATALLLFAPLMLLIAALIKLTSRGPVLYTQERMGLDGRTFRMLKFRSMWPDAERATGAVWPRADDARCTPIGAILRQTNFDELPQFWNVLRGEMSLIGPRPERPVFVQQFRGRVPHYMLRHKVKAGITGWAQVNGWRGDTSLARRIECDLFYIRNWSLGLDLKILTMTLWRGFTNRNA